MENSEKKKSGFGVAALVLGIIGIVLSFIPFINNIAFILGVLAIIFGIVCLCKKASKGFAIAGLVLGILACIITYQMQAATADALNEFSDALNEAITSGEFNTYMQQ